MTDAKDHARHVIALRAAHDHADAHVLPAPSQPYEVAQALARTLWWHADGHTLTSWRGAFWQWDGTAWRETTHRSILARLYEHLSEATYLDAKRGAVPWDPNRRSVADVIEALEAHTHQPDNVEAPTWRTPRPPVPARELVAVANGLLHVPTRRLLAHTPAYFTLASVPFPYDAEALAPQRWLRFLADLWPDDPDSVAAVQEWFGYCLSNRTDLHKIMLMVGPTRAGKGVLGRVLAALVGETNTAGPTLSSLSANFGLAPLLGKSVAVIADARLGHPGDHHVVERLLSISGEDALTVDRKYREPWTGKLPTRFLVISNELPRLADASGAIVGRFVMVRLTRSFLGAENTRLTTELLAELPGILNWALTGLDRLTANGRFTEPASARDEVDAMRELASPVRTFLAERCEVGPYEVRVDVLYSAWRTWSQEQGTERITIAQVFGRDLRAALPTVGDRRPRDDDGPRHRYYTGLRVRPLGQ